MAVLDRDDVVQLPRAALPLPVLLRPPGGFDAGKPETWPEVDGRLEYVGGQLLYMPPCGDTQQDVAASVVAALYDWSRRNPGFVVAGNEAGMLLGGDARAADAAVWRGHDAAPRTGGFRRSPPVLAVEVAGRDEGESRLREKAAWYRSQGVEIVWLVLPESREVVVVSPAGEARLGADATLRGFSVLPALEIAVAALFEQL